jgi:hypothetical protein
LGRNARIYLLKSEAISARVFEILENNLKDATKSTIAKEWARRIDSDVEYAFSLLTAFQKGIMHGS